MHEYIGLLCTCTTCLLLSDTLLYTGKAQTTSLDETRDDIVLNKQEATEGNEQDETLGNPQEEDLDIAAPTEAVGKISVGGAASRTNKTFLMDFNIKIYMIFPLVSCCSCVNNPSSS